MTSSLAFLQDLLQKDYFKLFSLILTSRGAELYLSQKKKKCPFAPLCLRKNTEL